MNTASTHKDTSLLFVAGVPSTLKKQNVLDFFSSFGSMSLAKKGTHGSEKLMSGSGYCVLECPDRRVADHIVNRKQFEFMGRTLTVTYFVTGLELIIQNKKTNKCRVIFKKVHGRFSEEIFKAEIENQYGPLQALFQYKNKNPKAVVNHKVSNPLKFTVFSAVFSSRDSAKAIVDAGSVTLSDGSSVLVEKFDMYQSKKRATEKGQKKMEVCVQLTHKNEMIQRKKGGRQEKTEGSRSSIAKFATVSKNQLLKPTSKAYQICLNNNLSQNSSQGSPDLHLDHQNLRYNFNFAVASRLVHFNALPRLTC